MPTSRDLTSGGSLSCTILTCDQAFFFPCPPKKIAWSHVSTIPECQQLRHPHPTHKFTQPPLPRTLFEDLHELHAIKRRNNLCQPWLNIAEMNVPETEQLIKKIQFYKKILKHRKAQKPILSGRFCDQNGRVGGQCHIQETPGWSARVGTYALVTYS